jgi:methylglyoxal synthase
MVAQKPKQRSSYIMSELKTSKTQGEALASLAWSAELIRAVSDISRLIEFGQGEILCHVGKFEEWSGLLLTGELFVQSEHGAAKSRIRPVDIFGEIAFLLPRPRSADVIASRDGSYLRLHFPVLRDLLSGNPRLAAEWYGWLSCRLAERVLEETQDQRTYVALIAHDNKKQELIDFARRHQDTLRLFDLTATGTTARRLLEQADVSVTRAVASGPLGGDQAIGQLITTGNIKAVIFFRDPLNAHPHEADVQALMRLCDVYRIPLATNAGSADLLLKRLENE